VNAPSEARALRLPRRIDIARTLSAPPPTPDFVLPGLPVGAVGALVAPGAAGKTMFLLQLCAALAMGIPVFGGALFESDGHPPMPAKATLVLAEETFQLMHIRLHAVAAEMMLRCPAQLAIEGGNFLSRLDENLCLYPLAGDLPMRLDERREDSYGVDVLEALAAGSRLVVLDPLRQVHGGDENCSAAMTHVVQVMQRVACRTQSALLVAHHANKWSSANGQGDRAAAARGSCAFTDAVRWQMNLSDLDEASSHDYRIHKEDLRHYVRVDLAKANYLPPQPPVVLKRCEGGVLTPLPRTARRPGGKQSRSTRGRT
jgi:RecA-family ATPase